MEQATCEVCPRGCRLADGEDGFCDVRAGQRDSVRDLYYSAIAWPGVRVRWGADVTWGFSGMRNRRVAEVYLPGCNLKCDFCVGPFLSRIGDIRGIRWIEAADLVRAAAGLVDVMAFTGGEPSIHVEYLESVMSQCKDRGILTCVETNGYMTRSTAEKLAKHANYVGLGLKASLDPAFYKQKFAAETQPILGAAKIFVESGCELILTDLTDPNLWEDRQAFETLVRWIVESLGSETRLALSSLETTERTHVTSQEQRQAYLEKYQKIATEAGLKQVFFQVDARKRAEERREHLEKIGLYRTLEQLGISPSAQQW